MYPAVQFEEAFYGRNESRLTRTAAALILGVCDRTFRRYIDRYGQEGLEGLPDRRLARASFRRAPVDEAMAAADWDDNRYRGWDVDHFFAWYLHEGGRRGYAWVNNALRSAGLVSKPSRRGVHRKPRERALLPGTMLHQDGCRHEWVPGRTWDLIVTMDDATGEHYSMFFVEEEGAAGSFQGIREVIVRRGLFGSLCTDQASHYWFTPGEGGRVSRTELTQFGRAMKHLGIRMVRAYSPEARGRSGGAFATHRDRLVKELAFHGITEMHAANRYLSQVYLPGYNAMFATSAPGGGSAFVPWRGEDLDDILCQQDKRTVSADNCVSFEGKKLQIPENPYRRHYVRARVRVHRYPDGSVAIFHGARKLADYDPWGKLREMKEAA